MSAAPAEMISSDMSSRAHRVWLVLHTKAPFDTLLKNEPLVEALKNGETVSYPQVCADIAQQFKDRGVDACTVQKLNIIQEACRFFNVDVESVAMDSKPDIFSEEMPTGSRIKRVDSVLKGQGLSEVKVEINVPSGPVLVSEDAIKVAKTIHDAKLDACSMKKEDILKYWTPPQKPESEEVVDETPAAPEVEAEAPAVVPVAKKAPVRPVVKKAAPASPPVESVETEEDSTIDVPWPVAIYTLLVGAYQLAQLDKSEGQKERRKRIEDLAKEYHRALR